MAQQSARRGGDNQSVPPCFEHAHVIWTQSANSHTGRRLSSCRTKGRTDDSIRPRATTNQKFSLAWSGASTDGTDFDGERARRIEVAHRLWDAGQEPHGTPLVAYLAGRGITMAPPPCLRWAPRCWHPETRSELPAMLARIDNLDGELIGVSRTWLYRSPDGIWRRRDGAMLGRASGGAVRLAPAAETLLAGEGLESCLAAMQSTTIPAWAALSTSGLMALTLPPEVQHLIIVADHDRSGAGERAARLAAARWLNEGRKVRLALPREPGTDMADVLLGHARITGLRDVTT